MLEVCAGARDLRPTIDGMTAFEVSQPDPIARLARGSKLVELRSGRSCSTPTGRRTFCRSSSG